MIDQGRKNLTKNTTLYISSLICQKLISFVYFSLLATRLGAVNMGKYFFAFSFVAIFYILIDLGLINVLIRNTAEDNTQTQRIFSLNLAIKIPLAILTYALILVVSNLLGYATLLKEMIAVTGLIMVFDSFTLTFYGLFRGRHNLRFESLGTIIFQLIVFILGFTALHFTQNPFYMLTVVLTASLFNFTYSLLLVKFKLKLAFRLFYEKKEIFLMMKETIFFALSSIFAKVYAYIDTVFLSVFSTAQAIGYYSLPYKMTFALQFVPLAFMASLYPLFSSFYKKDKNELAKLFERSLFFLLLIVLPVACGTIILGQRIIIGIYGQEYQPSIFSLQILMIGLIFVFMNFPASNLLNACHEQKRQTKNMALIMVFNIVLNLVLIKAFDLSFIGASISSSVSSLILFIVNFYFILKIITFDLKEFLMRFVRLFLSLIVMLFIVSLTKDYLNLFVNIILAAIVYSGGILLTKSVTIEEIKQLYQSLFKKPHEESPSHNP